MAKTDYALLNRQLEALLVGEDNWLANLANASALLYEELANINWVGFYLLQAGTLVLGPFQGKPACVRIGLGEGVCGTTAEKKVATIVADVHQFPGHITCDPASRSEIVLPMLRQNGSLIGVLDVDSPLLNRFDARDEAGLAIIVQTLLNACAWQKLALDNL